MGGEGKVGERKGEEIRGGKGERKWGGKRGEGEGERGAGGPRGGHQEEGRECAQSQPVLPKLPWGRAALALSVLCLLLKGPPGAHLEPGNKTQGVKIGVAERREAGSDWRSCTPFKGAIVCSQQQAREGNQGPEQKATDSPRPTPSALWPYWASQEAGQDDAPLPLMSP